MADASHMSALIIAGLLGTEAAFLPACASLAPCPAQQAVAQRQAARDAGGAQGADAPALADEHGADDAMIYPARWVEGNTLVSTGLPEVRAQVDDAFTYVGSTRYTLIDEVGAEAFLFAESSDASTIRRSLAFIFEGALPGSGFTYDYTSDDVTVIAGDPYISDTFFFWDMDEAIEADPARDTAIIDRYLADMGLDQPDDGLIRRFVRVVTPDRRNEFIIVYSEDLADLGYSRRELEEGGDANHLIPSISASLHDRAIGAFTIIDDSADGATESNPAEAGDEAGSELVPAPEPPIDLEDDDGTGLRA